jgi:hypothetical protein
MSGYPGTFTIEGKGMQVPQRHHVVAVARQLVEIFAPEIEIPDRGDVGLCAVAHVGVAGRAQVERDVELGAAQRQVRIAIGVGHGVDAARADLLGEFESAVHRAAGVETGDGETVLAVRVECRSENPSGFSGA